MAQRIRVIFSRGEATKYISHLDVMRFWERAFRRAQVPLAFSEGFRPHPRFALAAPLPVGVTSQAELMDVFLDAPMEPGQVLKALSAQMAPGIEVLAAEEVGLGLPSLQSLMRYAEYRVVLETERSLQEVEEVLARFLAAASFPWEHVRDGELRRYDLRSQVDAEWVEEWRLGKVVLGMRLQTDSNAAGRPEQATLALGFPQRPLSIHRTRLVLAEQRLGLPGRSPRTSQGRRPGLAGPSMAKPVQGRGKETA